MNDLTHIYQSGVNALLVVSSDDLKQFAESLISSTRRIVEAQYKDVYYTIDELAKLLHVSETSIYNYIRKGKLTPIKMEGRTLFARADVEQAMRNGTLGKYIHK